MFNSHNHWPSCTFFKIFLLIQASAPVLKSSKHLSLTSIKYSNVCFELDTTLSWFYLTYLLDFVLTYCVICDNIRYK